MSNTRSRQSSFEIEKSSIDKTKISLKRTREVSPEKSKGNKKQKMNDKQKKEIVDEVLAGVSNMLDGKLDGLVSSVSANTARIEKIESELHGRVDELKAEVKAELKEEMKSITDTSYNLCLAQQVEKSDRNLLVFGLSSPDPPKALTELAKKIGISESDLESVKIVSWFRLGKADPGGKPKPVCFVLGSYLHRNAFLEKARFLDKGISFERDVPQPYRQEFKRFKALARKQKIFMPMQTRIQFVQHEMQLRVRSSASEGWRILKQFTPKPEQVKSTLLSKGNTVSGGEHVPPPNVELIEKARRTIMITGFPEENIDQVVSHLTSYVKSPLAKKMGTVAFKKGRASLLCEDSEAATAICKIGRDRNIEWKGKKIGFECFED